MMLTKTHKIIIGVVGLGILAYATKKYWMPKKKDATTPALSTAPVTATSTTPATTSVTAPITAPVTAPAITTSIVASK